MALSKASLLASGKKDFISGLIVFFIALPLCLGIAQASGAPLFSGIVAGIIGGLVIGVLSQSSLSVSGPAAGLVAIVITSMAELGSFEIFLCAVMLAGVLQIVMGFLKAGSIANFFPVNVIEGMLAGIGLTIIFKQIPDAVGFGSETYLSGLPSGEDGFSVQPLLQAIQNIHLGSMIIAVLGLLLLILWQTKSLAKIKFLPVALIVVLSGSLLNQLFVGNDWSLALGKNQLVSLPIPEDVGDFFSQFVHPDFSGFAQMNVWKTAIIIALVASLETLLCIEATDKMDPLKRYTSGNVELKAQGVGNMLSGLIGGLPITSVIVRSSANINSGAQSKLSTIFHGTLLLVCVGTIPAFLNLIPKASLASILIFTGYRLCRPSLFKHIYQQGGWSQFFPFIITVIAVVSLDLLQGVGLGLIVSLLFLLRKNMNISYFYKRIIADNGEVIKLNLAQEVSFLNKACIKETFKNIPQNSTLIIDASNSEYIDFDVLELISDFSESQAPDRNIKVELIGFKNIYKLPEGAISDMIVTNNVLSASAGKHKKLIKQLVE